MSSLDERLIRKVFSEIVAGYSLATLFGDIVYIKHFSSIDLLEFDYKYQRYLTHARDRGLPTEPERLELLKRDGLWDDKKEELIKTIRDNLQSAVETKRNYHSLRDIEAVNEQIKDGEQELTKVLTEKYNLIGECAENYARRKIDIEQIFASFYKDGKLSSPMFSKEDTETLEDEKLDELILTYNLNNANLDEKVIRKVSVSSDFQTMYAMSDNLFYFFGIPISKLSHFQVKLAAYGNYFKTILTGDKRPPADILNDPDALEDWYFARTNVQKIIDKNTDDGKGVSLVGMSRKELEYLGIETEQPRKSLKKAAQESGGELTKEQMMGLGFL